MSIGHSGKNLILAALLAAQASLGGASPLLVSAAASLTDVLAGLNPAAEAFIGSPIRLNFGGSGALRRQIEEGAPVDVFFPAAAVDMEILAAKGLLARGGSIDLLSNSIVLVGGLSARPASTAEELKGMLGATPLLAIGNPDSVPAGRYAMQALESLGLGSAMAGRLALGGSVREVLRFVQSGSAPLGIVFLTDTKGPGVPDGIRILFRFPSSWLPTPVTYPIAAIAGSKNEAAARAYIQFMQGALAAEAFRKAGFTTP